MNRKKIKQIILNLEKVYNLNRIEKLASKELTSSYLLAPLRKSNNFPKGNRKGWNAEARRRWDS